MNREELRELIVGAVATVPTPFDDDFNVDNGRISEATERWIDQGLVTGKAVIKVAASMGEGPQLDDDEWPGLLSAVVGAARGRVPIVGAIYSKDTVRSIRHAKQALDLGAVAIQVNPPLNSDPTQDDILRYYGALSDAVDIGVIVYNNPWAPNGRIFIETLRKIVEFENIVAIKWEPGTDADFEEVFELASTVNIIDNTIDLIVASTASWWLGAGGRLAFSFLLRRSVGGGGCRDEARSKSARRSRLRWRRWRMAPWRD